MHFEMKKNTVLRLAVAAVLFATLLITTHSLAQTPTTQDCRGAIPVCDFIYEEDSTASGYGNYFEIPNGGNGCPNNHCMDGEKNSRWYVFTVISSGNLKFQITPQVSTDDYDWAVFDLSDYHCEDIWGNANLIMSSCNAAGGAGYQGATGINTFNGGTKHCNNGGPTNKWNIDLPVFEGETYVLVVSDWTQTPGGYTLNFSASSASIFDDQDPYIEYIGGDQITDCNTNDLFFRFNENVKCNSIQKQDFVLSGPGGPYVIDSLYGETCDIGGANEREYTLYFTPSIKQGGVYTLTIKNFAFIKDACDNYAQPESYDFTIDLDSPLADAGEDIDIAYAGTANLNGSASGGSGEYSYHWEPADLLDDPDIPNPTTVSLTSSTAFVLTVDDTLSLCEGQDTVWVNVVGGPLGITVAASSGAVCNGDRVDLFTYPDGGSGNYTYNWTSNPPYFNSEEQNPSDFPTADVTYIVEVYDGFTTVTDSVSVVVKPKPVADAGPDQTINKGTSTVLEGSASGGSGTYGYEWEPASELQQNDIPNPTTLPLFDQTIFSLFINDANGCQSEPDQVVITPEGEALSASPLADPMDVCLGQSTTITAWASGGGGEYTYQWTSSPPGFTSDQEQFSVTPLVTTRYDLVVTDQDNNQVSAHVNVTVNPLPVIDLDPSGMGRDTILVCVRDSVLLDAGFDSDPSGTEYFWLNANLVSRFYKASTNGNWLDIQDHSVRVTHGGTGCQNTGQVTVVFDFGECQISVPEYPFDLDAAIDLHPNPNQGDFSLTINNDLESLTIKIMDTRGRVVYQRILEGRYAAGYSIDIRPGIHSKGIYFVQLISGSKRVVKKMVVR